MHNTNIPFYTVDELLDVLSNSDAWNKVWNLARKCSNTNTNTPPAKETNKMSEPDNEPKEDTTDTSTTANGSIFDEDSLTQAIRQYENEINDETVAYQKVIDAKKEKINQLKARLVKEQMKTRVTQQGNDMAVTMVVENARKIADTLNSILNQENVPDKITITIPDVG